jgi:signal transduction histidine kinase
LGLHQLEQRRGDIEAQLLTLAHYTPRGGFGRIGYRSEQYDNPDHSTALRIDLAEETSVDLVVLVPTIIRDPVEGFRPDSFPQALRILDEKGQVLAERSFIDEHLQCIAPFIIPLNGKSVSRLTVEATHLTPRFFDGKYVFQLAEVLVFSGHKNVALGRPVKASPLVPDSLAAWDPNFVTDGYLPYLMNSSRGTPSRAYLSPPGNPADAPLHLLIDLQKSYPIDQLNLHLIDQSDTIPQGAPDGIGMPRLMRVEGANQADFSDAHSLLEIRCDSAFEANPIMMWLLSGESFRYIRLTALEPYLFRSATGLEPQIGFAEIELLSNGQNVAATKTVVVPGEQSDHHRPASALTDNRNIFGKILPIRQWMEELALRHALETERPLVAAELATHYARQKKIFRLMIWMTALLAVGIGFAIVMERMFQMRKLVRLKERFAADLHDELGANLHTIGLLAQLIQRKIGSLPEDASTYLQRIQSVTHQSGVAVRNITKLQTAAGLYGNLEADMQRAATRILANVEHDLTVEGRDLFNRLPPQKRIDLFLFYKECLINICRHSGATRVQTRLSADRRQVILNVKDNGRGLPDTLGGAAPSSLARRAKLLGANLQVQPAEEGGCSVTLTMRVPRRLKEK